MVDPQPLVPGEGAGGGGPLVKVVQLVRLYEASVEMDLVSCLLLTLLKMPPRKLRDSTRLLFPSTLLSSLAWRVNILSFKQ